MKIHIKRNSLPLKILLLTIPLLPACPSKHTRNKKQLEKHLATAEQEFDLPQSNPNPITRKKNSTKTPPTSSENQTQSILPPTTLQGVILFTTPKEKPPKKPIYFLEFLSAKEEISGQWKGNLRRFSFQQLSEFTILQRYQPYPFQYLVRVVRKSDQKEFLLSNADFPTHLRYITTNPITNKEIERKIDTFYITPPFTILFSNPPITLKHCPQKHPQQPAYFPPSYLFCPYHHTPLKKFTFPRKEK